MEQTFSTLVQKYVRGGSLTRRLSCERTPRPQSSDPSQAQGRHLPKLYEYRPCRRSERRRLPKTQVNGGIAAAAVVHC